MIVCGICGGVDKKPILKCQYWPKNPSKCCTKLKPVLRPLADRDGKTVFCHNDALLGNILVTAGGQTRLIDYEYAGVNYREYDIANHFAEFVGVGDPATGFLDYDKHYPSPQFQLKWIKEYLGADVSSDSEAEDLQRLVDKFSPLPNLVWGVWSLVQAKHSAIDFDFLDYARQRFNFYQKRKTLVFGDDNLE